ncbi:hypothetical protein B0T21DRAFT_80367 [Apiosordaria backusii]|uniref:Uncharacterized protein n=1 Tax=Apiosordaria backusii TaxID=314023 RepID=A0AA40DM36_9PEZI|nr:hypothetical protein B0T21DRAFT_80367 [Apiosordaria backusii]
MHRFACLRPHQRLIPCIAHPSIFKWLLGNVKLLPETLSKSQMGQSQLGPLPAHPLSTQAFWPLPVSDRYHDHHHNHQHHSPRNIEHGFQLVTDSGELSSIRFAHDGSRETRVWFLMLFVKRVHANKSSKHHKHSSHPSRKDVTNIKLYRYPTVENRKRYSFEGPILHQHQHPQPHLRQFKTELHCPKHDVSGIVWLQKVAKLAATTAPFSIQRC